MKSIKNFLPILALALPLMAQTVRLPNVIAGTANQVKWNLSKIPIGGHVATLAAGTLSLTASLHADCSAPSYGQCLFIYATVSGATATAAVTPTLGTAVTSSTVLLAFVETDSSGVPTQITYPWQSGTMFDSAGLLAGSTVSGVTALSPNAAGTVPSGTNALPFTGYYFGTAATNNFFLTGAATSALRTITLPDFGATNTFGLQDPNVGTKQLLINLSNGT